MLTSFGLLLLGSAFAEQENPFGKDVSPEEAASVKGGVCGNQFKSGTASCGSDATVLCINIQRFCSAVSFSSQETDGDGNLEPDPDPEFSFTESCYVCTNPSNPTGDLCGEASIVIKTQTASCNGG